MPRKGNHIESIFDDESDLNIYFRDIENSGGLSAEEERELARRIALGDEMALGELVTKNLRFVVSVAKEYINRGVSLGDLIGAGNLGLITAAKRFDGTKGFKFISYAVWWVRQSILQTLAENSRTVRLPLNKIGELGKLNKADRRLTQVLGRPPTPEEVVADSEFENVEEVQYLRTISQKNVYLDTEIGDDSATTFMNNLVDDALSSDKNIEIVEKREELLKAIRNCLSDRERQVVFRYHGLDGADPQTLEQIGADIGLTRERIRQILNEKAIPKLRNYFIRNHLTVL